MSEVIKALRDAEADYFPSDEVCGVLNEIAAVPIVGPLATGKSTCIGRIISMDPGLFGGSRSFTTRERREEETEDEYRWFDGGPEGLANILDAVNKRELVQYAVHPATDVVSGFDPSDFAYPYTMLDAPSFATPPLRKLPFKQMIEVTLVMSPRQWQFGLDLRNGRMDAKGFKERLLEDRQSLSRSLEEGDGTVWVNNIYGALGKTAQEVRGLALGEREPNPGSRYVGEQMLKHIDTLLS